MNSIISRETLSEAMRQSIEWAKSTMRRGDGGPFGAAVISPEGEIVYVGSNSVLKDHDPTAHAEVNAIRGACAKLGTHDLSGYVLVATGYPCAMCLAAIIWANIRTVYYGCTPKDADAIGFRDDFIYDYIHDLCHEEGPEDVLTLTELNRADCLKLFNEYHETAKQMY